MVDIEELKKLPAEEKWKIIDALEASMEGEGNEPEFDAELLAEMEQRYQDMLSGKDKGYTWAEAEAIWKKTLQTAPVHEQL